MSTGIGARVTGKHYDSGDYPASVAGARRMIGLDAVRARQGRFRRLS